MSRRQQDPEAEYYQEKPKGVNAREESTRRKFIRWFKTHLGHDHKKVSRQPTSLPTPPPQGHTQQRHHKHSLDYSSTSESNASTASNQYYSHSVGELVPPPAPARNAPDYRVHVLIVGGGIGGLCLAQGLKKHGIPFTVFERDPSPNYRSQGYRVRIDSMGYESLKANMNESTFEVFLRSTGHFLPGVEYIDAVTGGAVPHELEQQHMATRASRRHRHMFSADRAMLRSLMLSDLEEDEVQFGMRFKHYEILPNGRVQVTFENGKIVRGSILVGADGTTSRVRRHYIPRCLALLDTDSNAIYGKTLRTPELDAMFPPDNTTIVLSQYPPMSLVVEPRGVNSPRNSSFDESSGEAPPDMPDYICWVLIGRARHFHLDDSITERALFSMEPHQVARLSYAMTRHWSPQIRALFKFQDPEWCSFLRISTMAPKLRSWQPSPVTLMGDAVHTMVPAGFGCNTALFDAHMMVKCFAELGVGVEAIKKYEHQLRAAGREGISLSLEAGKIMFGLPHVDDMRTVAQ